MGINKKIKVCHIISGDLWAGAEVQMLTMTRALHDAGEFDLQAIVLNHGNLADCLVDSGINTVVVDESKNGFLLILKKISDIADGSPIDIIHTHRYKENILGALLKRKGKVRHLIQTVHGLNENLKGINNIKMNFYSTLNAYMTRKYFDRVIAVSKQIEERLGGKINRNQLITIHNCIDINRIVVCKNKNEIREELGIGPDAILIGSVGRMVPIKGYDVFLKMAKLLLNDSSHFKFILVGNGPLKFDLEGQIQYWGLKRNVMLPGFRSDIYDIINAMDIFVLSSLDEGIPIALLEAMALGKPIVATSVGGIGEIIQHNDSGLLVESGDFKGLAASCQTIVNDSELKSRLEYRAKIRVAEGFSIAKQRESVSALYREMVKSS